MIKCWTKDTFSELLTCIRLMSKRPAAAVLLHPGFARGGRFWQCTNCAILVVNAYSYLSKRNLSKEKKAESFYNVKYGSSFIASENQSQSLSNKENIKTGVSWKIVCLDILIHVFVLKTTETTVLMFSLHRFFWLTFDVITDNPYLTL